MNYIVISYVKQERCYSIPVFQSGMELLPLLIIYLIIELNTSQNANTSHYCI